MAKSSKKSNLMDSVSLMAGGVLANVAKKYIPVENEMIKNAAVVAVGYFIGTKSGAIGSAGKGMMAVGAANMAASFGIGEVDDYSLVGEVTEEEMNGVDTEFVAGTNDLDGN